MGIGVTATLVDAFWHQRILAGVLLAAAWLVLLGLVTAFTVRCLRSREAFLSTVRHIDEVPMWGTVAMAMLTVGSSTSGVLPSLWPTLSDAAWRIDLVLWLLGTLIGLVSTVTFTLRLLGRACGRPVMVWGLAVVSPMVSSTSGALLVGHVPVGWRVGLLTASAACFCTALFMGWAVFAGACHHAWRVEPLPLAVTCTAWIPVALVGQSVAAIQAIGGQLRAMLSPVFSAQVPLVVNTFSWIVLACGVPLVVWVVVVTVRAFARRMPFNPSWWALTFPMGSMALGHRLLAVGAHSPAVGVLGQVWTAALCLAVVVCAGATGAALVRRK